MLLPWPLRYRLVRESAKHIHKSTQTEVGNGGTAQKAFALKPILHLPCDRCSIWLIKSSAESGKCLLLGQDMSRDPLKH